MASTTLDPNKIRAYTDFGAEVVSEAVAWSNGRSMK